MVGCWHLRTQVIVSEFNRLDGDRYFDVESSTSFEFDHITQVRCRALSRLISLCWCEFLTDRFSRAIISPRLAKRRPCVCYFRIFCNTATCWRLLENLSFDHSLHMQRSTTLALPTESIPSRTIPQSPLSWWLTATLQTISGISFPYVWIEHMLLTPAY